jgi:DNA repair photolyase
MSSTAMDSSGTPRVHAGCVDVSSREAPVSVTVPLLSAEQIARLPSRAREVVEYRKSGLSLNHIQGCPLDCAYCIRHTYGVWDLRQPRALMSDEDAVRELVSHPYFQAHTTPLQIFNRATDPFLPRVKEHLFRVLEALDALGVTNHVLVITRFRIDPEDCERLNQLENVRPTLLLTYSGITDERIEPVKSSIAATSLTIAHANAERYRVILYWRPLVPGLNDSEEHLARAVELSHHAHATVFTGLFYRDEIADYYRANGIPEPYDDTARRKIVPETLERRVLDAFADGKGGPLFRKTSCSVSFVHGSADYNGHYGIRELCDICPAEQLAVCAGAHHVPTPDRIRDLARRLPGREDVEVVDITERAVLVAGLDEQPRYFLQHGLGFQVHDVRHPHRHRLHGRADVGWSVGGNDEKTETP